MYSLFFFHHFFSDLSLRIILIENLKMRDEISVLKPISSVAVFRFFVSNFRLSPQNRDHFRKIVVE